MALSAEHKRLANLIQEIKPMAIQSGISWDESTWNITHLEHRRAHNKFPLTLHFIQRKVNRSEVSCPFKQPFADFAKVFIWLRMSRGGSRASLQKQILIALRLLYQSLLDKQTTDPTKLTVKDFNITIEKALELYSLGTLHKIGSFLQETANWLDANKLCSVRINFHNPIPTPSRKDNLDPESQALGLKKMPSDKILETLAEISNNPLNNNERIIMRIIDLLLVGGFRIGEVLTLPLNCWVEESILKQDSQFTNLTQNSESNKNKRFGLRYWPEKDGDPIVKWLPDIAVPLAKRAVTDLTTLCSDARKVAHRVEQHPDRVLLDTKFSPTDLITAKQFVEEILGLKVNYKVRCLEYTLKLKPTEESKTHRNKTLPYLYRVADIEKALVKHLGPLEVVRINNSTKQMLSESLCVVFKGQFSKRLTTWTVLPEIIDYVTIQTAIGKRAGNYNIFSCRNLSQPDGNQMGINTLAFRHWVNTLADRGGLTDLELARWMGRHNIQSNQVYKHGTVEQRVGWAKDLVRSGGLIGEVTETYHMINDPIEKEQFLETFVNVVHFTPYGVCIHDFSIEPCRYHLNCLAGCKEYMRTKGDQTERKKIKELRVFTSEQLKLAEQFEKDGTYGANNWVDFNKRIMAGIEAALSVDKDSSTSEDDIQVFPNGKSLFQPV